MFRDLTSPPRWNEGVPPRDVITDVLDENVRPNVRLRPHLPADVVKTVTARTWRGRGPVTARPRDLRGGQIFSRVSPIKGGFLPLFPHFQPSPVE
jgi:hypothetical protein